MKRRFWQAIFAGIILAGAILFLPGPEAAMVRQWIEGILGRWR
jgi:hypothetical protein